MKIVSVRNLCFSYQKNSETLRNVSFDIESGSYVSIVGDNGSGKSTLAKLLIGLLNKDSGSIEVVNLPLNNKNVHEIRKKVAIVFQNPDNQFIGATVEDDIAFGLENRCVKQNEMQKIVFEWAKNVGMLDYLNKEPSYLSGGQKQRVALAGALSLSPSLLILDEATSMLDPKGKKEIFELINKLKKENEDLTIISITHDVEEAYLSDQIIVINDGEIVLQGKPDEVFSNKKLLNDIGLDVPFMMKLKEKLLPLNIAIDVNESLEEIGEKICRLK